MVESTTTQASDQYSLAKILGIWAVVALPMLLITYVIAPALIPRVNFEPGFLFFILAILGMVWQFVVSMIVLYRELGTLRWSVISKRMWYQTPRDPKTGVPNIRLLWWSVPLILLVNGLLIFILVPPLTDAFLRVFPALKTPFYADSSRLFSPELAGQWWLLGLILISNAFNYFLGEELLFRGVLLPKMNGVFSKWDWLANAVLFAGYHLHTPQAILGNILIGAPYIWASKHFRSNWFSVIVHGFMGIILFVLVLLFVSGIL
jgi:membrane protease YdiL (CAAX protease family)